jgi:polysaccharide biosynthesis transport protein
VNRFDGPGSVSQPQTVSLLQPSQLLQFHDRGAEALLRLIKRRIKWIIGSIVGCALIAILITLRTEPVYDATATIELNKGSSMDIGISDVLSQQLIGDEDALQIDQATESAILQGDSLALEVIQRLNLASKPPFALEGGDAAELGTEAGLPLEDAPKTRTHLLSTFKSNLLVKPVRQTRLIQVTYQSHDPKQAAQIANAMIDAYKAQYLKSHYQSTTEASDWLTKQLSALKANVEDSEKRLTDFEKENGILSLSVASAGTDSRSGGEGQIHSPVIQKLDTLNADLTTAETNRIEKEAIYHLVSSNNGDVVLGLENDPLARESNSIVLTQGGGLSNLQQLRQQENSLKINIATASDTYGQSNRHLLEMQTQLHAVQDQIRNEMQQIVSRAQADFQLAQQTEEALQKRVDKQQAEASRLNEKTVQFAVLSQEANSRKKLYEDLYTKLQEANVSAGLKATNISIVDPARSQSIPVRPKLPTNLAMGILFGVFLGFATAYGLESLDRSVADPMEFEQITGIPVIGVIPDFGERSRVYGARLRNGVKSLVEKTALSAPTGKTSVWMVDYPDSAAAEAFRALRTSVTLSRAGNGPRTILVTSCAPGEGKTTVTTNLAVTLAQHNKQVIVIEADMRRPRMEHKLQVSNEVGLSSVLTGTSTAEAAIQRGVYIPYLDIMPSGPRPPSPADILGSDAFDELLQYLKARYEIILIDSPPALLVTDAVSMSFKVDSVIWVAQAGIVTRPQLMRAARLSERDRMPVIGFVVNRITRKNSEYGYEYTNSYYGEDHPNGA